MTSLGLPIPLSQRPGGPIPSAYLPAYKNIILASSPKAYWKCDETSGNPVDSSGNGNDMTTSTGTPVYRVKRGPLTPNLNGIRLPGGSSLSRSSPVSTVTNNFCFELWLCPEAVSANDMDVIYNGNAASNGWGLLIDGNMTIQVLMGGVDFIANSSTALTTQAWNHVVVARDATQWKYWINGALDGASLATTAPGAPSGGISGFREAASRQIVVAHAAIYESVLTLAQIQTRYRAATRGVYGAKIA